MAGLALARVRGVRNLALTGTVVCTLAGGIALSGAAGTASAAAQQPTVSAPGSPGVTSFFDLARKDCVGTARTTASKVWYTVAGGVLSDAYEPTVDNTNVGTLQYVVTDGTTFTDLQTREIGRAHV